MPCGRKVTRQCMPQKLILQAASPCCVGLSHRSHTSSQPHLLQLQQRLRLTMVLKGALAAHNTLPKRSRQSRARQYTQEASAGRPAGLITVDLVAVLLWSLLTGAVLAQLQALPTEPMLPAKLKVRAATH